MNPNDGQQQNSTGQSQTSQSRKSNSSKKIALIITVLIIIALGLWIYVAQTSDDSDVVYDNPGDQITELEEIQVSDNATVVFTQGSLSPETIRVRAGSTVTWSNQSDGSFTLVSSPQPEDGGLAGFSTNDAEVASGDSFSFTFSANGVYRYVVNSGEELSGTVIVD